MLDFDKRPINEVIEIAKSNNDTFAYNYIIAKYSGMIHGIIRKHNFYLPNGEYEDLVQEGYTGMYKAILGFNPESGSFENFCKTVIKRHMITAIKKATRLKHNPLNQRTSLDLSLPDNENLTMMDIIGFKDEVVNRSDIDTIDPEEIFIYNETYQIQKEMLENLLSKREQEIYKLHIEKKSYKEIMEELEISSPKTVDNTIQRIKRKYREVQLFTTDEYPEVDIKRQKI